MLRRAILLITGTATAVTGVLAYHPPQLASVATDSLPVTPTPTATPTPTPTPTVSGAIPPPVKGITVYTGGPGGNPKNVEQSFDLPVSVQAAPGGTNVKLWIYNPSDKKVKAGSPNSNLTITNSCKLLFILIVTYWFIVIICFIKTVFDIHLIIVIH